MNNTPTTGWRKSTYSGDQGACVEINTTQPHTIHIRDSKNPTGPTLTFTPTAWTTFTKAVPR